MATDKQKQPLVSIGAPAFNHEKFVGRFIQSALDQTEQDFELIIVDDCSSDNTVAEIEKFNDPRIRLIKHQWNMGINASINDCIEAANGKYIVMSSADDMFMPCHLKVATEYLEAHKETGIFYTSLQVIDENDKNMEVFKPKIMDRYELLHYLFMKGNPLFSPGMTIRAEILKGIIPLKMGVVQNQDTIMHIKMLLKNDIFISPEPTTYYRKHSACISSDKRVAAQSYAEQEEIMNAFLDMKDVEVFKRVFKDEAQDVGEVTADTIPFFLGQMALKSDKPTRKVWGLRAIMNFVSNMQNYQYLHKLYGFDFKQYLKVAEGLHITLDPDAAEKYQKKFKKYKKLSFKLLALAGCELVALLAVLLFMLF